MMTARRLRAAGSSARVVLATFERTPLELFGGRPSGQLLERLEALGIAFIPGVHVKHVRGGDVRLAPGARSVEADRIVTLPTVSGSAVPGLPSDHDGFLPVDAHGGVRGAYDVYAAGDAIAYPIKHGGLATQQADAVAESIAARCGVPLEPAPFRPVLRGDISLPSSPRASGGLIPSIQVRRPTGRSRRSRSSCPTPAPHLRRSPIDERAASAHPDRRWRRVAGLEALLALHRRLAGGVELTLIAPDEDFVSRPLAVAVPFTDEPIARVPERGEEHDPGQVSGEPLWWPPAKIAARELGPYLAGRLLPAA